MTGWSLSSYISASRTRIASTSKWRIEQRRQLGHIVRRVYGGKVDELKTKGSRRGLPLSAPLVARLLALRSDDEDGWIFAAANGEPFTPGNWLRRYIQPAAKKAGVKLSGWQDFRHTLSTDLRRSGTHPMIVSSVLGHSGVQLAMNVYDHVSTTDLVAPLAGVAEKLCPNVRKTGALDVN